MNTIVRIDLLPQKQGVITLGSSEKVSFNLSDFQNVNPTWLSEAYLQECYMTTKPVHWYVTLAHREEAAIGVYFDIMLDRAPEDYVLMETCPIMTEDDIDTLPRRVLEDLRRLGSFSSAVYYVELPILKISSITLVRGLRNQPVVRAKPVAPGKRSRVQHKQKHVSKPNTPK